MLLGNMLPTVSDGFLLGLTLPDDGGVLFFQNVGGISPDNMTLYSRR
jgi:hypothetical protein